MKNFKQQFLKKQALTNKILKKVEKHNQSSKKFIKNKN